MIASGTEKNAITRVLQGEELGTLFVSRENRLQFRKRWLAFGAKIAGSIVVDDGCAKLFARPAAAAFCRQACLPCREIFCRAAR